MKFSPFPLVVVVAVVALLHAPPALRAQEEVVAPAEAPTLPVTETEPATAPPPAAAPAPTATPMAEPPPPAAPAPVKPAGKPTSDECRDGMPSKGLLSFGLPRWVSGAVVGGALGGLAASIVGLGVAGLTNFLLARGLVPLPENASLPALYWIVLLALPVGALLGAVVGGVVAPFMPSLGLSKPCTEQTGGDPTLRQPGTT